MNQDLKTITILFRASHHIEEVVKQEVQAFGLNLSEFMVLEVLFHKGSLPVNAVLDKVLIPNSSMSYVIGLLMTKGLIIKQKDAFDKRVYVLHLTEAGSSLINKVYPAHKKKLKEILNLLSNEEEETLQALLKRIGKQ
ncbi:MAG TPA: MarR family transcriptional regulator [Firmicutes bacterium]|jgi:MarR family 2-MHQ and catechol resistance regulon transcriptional repressor|nr:MarR family transcriptional regulator [Bacillota bacterium]